MSPIRLCSCASVAAPRTIWCLVLSPCPTMMGGATGQPGSDSRVGTSTPSSCMVANETPDDDVTSGSCRSVATALFGTGPYPSELCTA